jgi:hypothetical protein
VVESSDHDNTHYHWRVVCPALRVPFGQRQRKYAVGLIEVDADAAGRVLVAVSVRSAAYQRELTGRYATAVSLSLAAAHLGG